MTTTAKSDKDRVVIFDTTLRDGEQCPGATMTHDEKLEVASLLDDMGVDIIEAGFPIASPADAEAVRQIAMTVRRPIIAALARTRRQDIEEAARSLAESSTPEQTVRRMDAIGEARTRLEGNVAPLLAVEAMMIALRPQA